MRITIPPVDVLPNEGFDPDKDIFGRALLGERLARLMSHVDEPLVVAVDGQWGSGKSTFLKMWAGHLRKQGFPVVYFDAFLHDFIKDPFQAIAGELIQLVKEKKKASSPRGKRLLNTTLKASRAIAFAGLGAGVKLATVGALSDTKWKELAADIGDAASDLTSKVAEEILRKREKDRAAISEFRAALQDLPELLSPKGIAAQDRIRPLIVIIDELDRCRPVFAMEMLERIKHFFSVRGVHFVLGVHTPQLQKAVSVVCGADDGRAYLRKFINLTFFLYEKADSLRERTARKYIKFLVSRMEFDTSSNYVRNLVDKITIIATDLDVDLRSIERIMSTVAIVLLHEELPDVLIPILAVLISMKVLDPQLYSQAKRGTLRASQARAFLNLDPNNSPKHSQLLPLLQAATEGGGNVTYLEQLKRSIDETDIDEPENIVPYIANEIIDRFEFA